MAKTTAEIKRTMTDVFVSNSVIVAAYGLDPTKTFDEQFSVVSLESLIFDMIAFCVFNAYKLFDAHRDEVKAIIDSSKAHTRQWYMSKARLYQHGYNLVADQDYYDNTILTPAAIEAAQVVKYAAATEVVKGIRIKVATIASGDLSPLSGAQLTGLSAYMNRIKDAGVRLYITSTAADSLRLTLKIYYNALVLDSAGARLDGNAATPIDDAIDTFLKSQPFNGLFVVANLTDALQKVDGVVIPHVELAEARYGVLPFSTVPVEYLPDSGYLRISSPSDLTIQYIPHEPI